MRCDRPSKNVKHFYSDYHLWVIAPFFNISSLWMAGKNLLSAIKTLLSCLRMTDLGERRCMMWKCSTPIQQVIISNDNQNHLTAYTFELVMLILCAINHWIHIIIKWFTEIPFVMATCPMKLTFITFINTSSDVLWTSPLLLIPALLTSMSTRWCMEMISCARCSMESKSSRSTTTTCGSCCEESFLWKINRYLKNSPLLVNYEYVKHEWFKELLCVSGREI